MARDGRLFARGVLLKPGLPGLKGHLRMAARLSLEMLLQGNFLQRKIRIQTEVASERMNAKCGGDKALGHQSRREWAARVPVPLSQHSLAPQRLDSSSLLVMYID